MIKFEENRMFSLALLDGVVKYVNLKKEKEMDQSRLLNKVPIQSKLPRPSHSDKLLMFLVLYMTTLRAVTCMRAKLVKLKLYPF